MSHIGESPQGLLPRLDIGGPELLCFKLCAQRIEQRGWLRTGKRVAENPEILRAEPLRAASSLQRVEIARERQPSATGAGVELDTLCDGLRTLAAGRVRRIKSADFRQGLVGPVARRCLGREVNACGSQHQVTRHILCGFEVLRQKCRRHNQRGADVREPFARRAVNRELTGRIERRNSGQIADRVGVFMIRQPAENDRTRIACIGQRDFVESTTHPVGQETPRFRRKLFGILGGHFTQSQLFLNPLPNVSVPLDLLQG